MDVFCDNSRTVTSKFGSSAKVNGKVFAAMGTNSSDTSSTGGLFGAVSSVLIPTSSTGAKYSSPGGAVLQGMSAALDARLEFGLETQAELKLKVCTYICTLFP